LQIARPAEPVVQLLSRDLQIVVKVRPHPGNRHHLDQHREQQQDHEREPRRGDREPPADWKLVEAIHAARNTYPAPRTVCRTRGSPPASSLRRRLETNTSTVLVSTRTW